MDKANAERLVRRWAVEVVAEGRLEVLDELLEEDAIDTSGGADARGRETFRARAGAVRDALSNRSVEVEALVVEDDRLAWRWVLRGVHTGRLFDREPTGKAVVLRGANFQRVRGGRVAEHWTLADLAGLARQLGE
jgi:predicted ester cyclase